MLSWFLLLFLCLHFHCTCGLDDQKYKRVITVNVNGSSNIDCCKYHLNCECSSLESALNYVRDNTLITIISSIVPLSSLIKITGHTTIGISGNNGTVISCNNTGGVSFVNCKNIDILGITWDQCGGAGLTGAVSMEQSSGIIINSCIFQHSITYGITIINASGIIMVTNAIFSDNGIVTEDYTGGLLIFQLLKDQMLQLSVINSTFENNGYVHYSKEQYGGGISIWVNQSSVSSSIYIENCTFLNNSAYHGAGIYVSAKQKNITLYLTQVYFENNTVGGEGNAIYYYSNGSFASFNITNSIIVNSIFIQISSTNSSLSIYDSSFKPGKDDINVNMDSYSKNLSVNFLDLALVGTQVVQNIRGKPHNCVLQFDKLTATNNSSLHINGKESLGFQCRITNSQFSNNNDNNPVVFIYNVFNPTLRPDLDVGIEIFNSAFSNNSNGEHVVHLAYDGHNNGPLGNVHLSHTSFTDNFDNDNTLFLEYSNLTINGTVLFQNNAALNGAGIYFTDFSLAALSDNVDIKFTKNVAALGGGAVYADYPSSLTNPIWVLFSAEGNYSVRFYDNQAHAAGSSIFINIPPAEAAHVNRDPTSEQSFMYMLKNFSYIRPVESHNSYEQVHTVDEIATSPYTMMLNSSAVCHSSLGNNGGTYSLSRGVMLGEQISVTAAMVDYFNNSAEPCLFQVKCSRNCDQYHLKGHTNYEYVLVSNNTLQDVVLIGDEDIPTSVWLYLSPVIGTIANKVRPFTVEIEVPIYPCYTGYKHSEKHGLCVCNSVSNLVQCDNSKAKIKKGYWYGKINGNTAIGDCPNDYCSYHSCEITEKFCDLSYDQCHSHRKGTACCECKTNYTLAFDSSDCIPTSECQVKWTVLVVIIVVVYWIVALFTIISVMYFVKAPTITGYVYGIIYFYSILDLFIGENLVVSDGVVQFVTIISGITNLTPRFLNRLCFVKGLSGIDQQFIHYAHPLAFLVMLFLISRVARRSSKATRILSRAGIVRSTSLLILLLYTSLSSTSLRLLRPLSFHGTDGLYTYLSPNIKYFSGRHIIYGIVALVCLFVVALGLPMFLFLQPFLKRCKRINFIRIIPLLDQFQQCYKLEYHWVASFYLICRLVIFFFLDLYIITDSNTRFYILQVVCFVIAAVHAWLRPYKDDKLNSLDQMILLVALMVVTLNIGIPFTSLDAKKIVNDVIVLLFALLPLVTFIIFILSLKFCCKRSPVYSRLRYV